MTALESSLSWMRRRRWWLGAGALVIAVAIVVVVIIVPGNGLMTPDRVVTGQETSQPGDDLRDVQFDGATGTAYFTYLANGQRRLAAYNEGSDTPLWTVDWPGILSGSGEGLVLTSAGRSLSALDSQTGQRLWTQSQLPLGGGTVHSSGFISASLVSNDGFANGVAVLDARTGQLKWKLDHPGRDRVMTIPGTTDMLHYQNGSKLRRLELATGTELMSADISAHVAGATSTNMTFSGDAVLLLVEHGGSTATGGTMKGLVFGLTDLKLRWEHEGRVTSIADDVFYAGSSETGRQVLDAQGRELWRPDEEVQIGRLGSTWGYVQFYAGYGEEKPPETDLFTYVDLRTGGRLAGDSREQAWFDTAGVLQMARGRDPQFWFLSLPDGATTNLGDLPVVWQDCAYSHTYIACFDHDGKPGMWRYRD
jgi:hypothetical protein